MEEKGGREGGELTFSDSRGDESGRSPSVAISSKAPVERVISFRLESLANELKERKEGWRRESKESRNSPRVSRRVDELPPHVANSQTSDRDQHKSDEEPIQPQKPNRKVRTEFGRAREAKGGASESSSDLLPSSFFSLSSTIETNHSRLGIKLETRGDVEDFVFEGSSGGHLFLRVELRKGRSWFEGEKASFLEI